MQCQEKMSVRHVNLTKWQSFKIVDETKSSKLKAKDCMTTRNENIIAKKIVKKVLVCVLTCSVSTYVSC